MNRPLPILFVFFAGLITLCALLAALASAASSLASSAAGAAASTALLTSQCTNAFLVVVAVLAGISIGVGCVSLRRAGGQKPYSPAHILPPATWHSPILLPPADDEDDELTQALIEILRTER
jgi:hypothetical protein